MLLFDLVYEASLSVTLIKVFFNGLALFAAASILEGVKVADFTRALLVALVLSVLNATIGRVFDFLALPFTILTLGLFSFVVDAVLILIAAYFMKGFEVRNFWAAFWFAIVVAIFNGFLHAIFI